MIQQNKIIENFINLIGFEKDIEGEIEIADSLLQSESGLYYQQGHPLITLKNMHSVAPQFSTNAVTAKESFELAKEYKKGQMCKSNGIVYKALVDVALINPDSKEAIGKWEKFDAFSEWLYNKAAASINGAIRAFYTERIASKAAKSLLDNKMLYQGPSRFSDISANTNSVVGFELKLLKSKNITVKINKIGIQTTKPCTINVHIMHTSQFEPIHTITVVKTKENSLEWVVLNDLYLSNLSDDVDAGSYYIVYDQAELGEGNHAIYKNMDWSVGPCSSCSASETKAWKTMMRYIELHPFKVNTDFLANNMWDTNDNLYTYGDNYGLNLDLSIVCDFTDFLIANKRDFQDLILKQFSIDMLREFAYNPNTRINRNSIMASKADIIYELEGDRLPGVPKSGLVSEYNKAIKALKINTNSIDSVCMPCKNNGIKYGTI